MAGVGRAQMSDGPRGGCPSVGIRGVVCGALWSPWLTALRDERDPLKSDAGVREGPVSCALMSGLLRGICRWPSWVCACVLLIRLGQSQDNGITKGVLCSTKFVWTYPRLPKPAL